MITFNYPETGKTEFPCICYDQFDLICKYVGLGPGDKYCVPSYYHFILKGPKNSEIRATALELKIHDPKLEDEYVVTNSLKIAAEYLKKSRYFVLGGNLDTWTEISKIEYIALRIIEKMDDQAIKTIEYDLKLQQITITGDRGCRVTDNAYDIYEFLKIVDALDTIRRGGYYEHIKEAKHE